MAQVLFINGAVRISVLMGGGSGFVELLCTCAEVHVGKVKHEVWRNARVSLYGLEKLKSGRLDVSRVCSAAEHIS